MSESSSAAAAKSEVTLAKDKGERLVWAFPLALLLPATILMLAPYAWPFISSVYRSFLAKDGGITLANNVKAFELYFRDVVFSLEIAVLSTLIATSLSILSAWQKFALVCWRGRREGMIRQRPWIRSLGQKMMCFRRMRGLKL